MIMVILIILITLKHFNILDIPNEADYNKVDQDWNKILFDSHELWIYYEYDEYLKSLKFFIDKTINPEIIEIKKCWALYML